MRQPPLPFFKPHIARIHNRKLGWLWAAYYSRADRLPFTTAFTWSTLTRYLRTQHAVHTAMLTPAHNRRSLHS